MNRVIVTPEDSRYFPRFKELGLNVIQKTPSRIKQWISSGMPLIPNTTMNTRSPSFVLLVLVVAMLGMILPEIFGLTNPYPQYGLPPSFNGTL